MNAAQRRKFRTYAIKVLREEAELLTGNQVLSDLIECQAELTKWENHKALRIKLQDQYGPALNGHWFYLVPADEYAKAALKQHLIVEES